jgi:hypothetical protein
VATSSRRNSPPTPPPVHTVQKDGLSSRLPQRAANVNTLARSFLGGFPTIPFQADRLTLACQPQSQSQLEEISDLVNLRTEACVELTRRLSRPHPSQQEKLARPGAALFTVILFIPEYGCGLSKKVEKRCCWRVGTLTVFSVGRWNWNSSLLNTALIFMHLESGRSPRFANCVCHRTDGPTPGGGTAILVRWDTDHYAVPVLGLQHAEATVIRLVLATRPLKLVTGYLSPTRTMFRPTGPSVWVEDFPS